MIDNISYYLEFDENQPNSDRKIFDIACKVIKTASYTSENKLRLKYVKPKPYLVKNTEEENIQIMELSLENKKSPLVMDNLLTIGIVKIKGCNKVLTINGNSKETNKFLHESINEITLSFLKIIGEFILRISISNASLMTVLKHEDKNQMVLYNRYLNK